MVPMFFYTVALSSLSPSPSKFKIFVFHIRNQKSYIIDDDKENDGACYKCFWKTVVCAMVAGGKPSRPDDIDT